MLGVNPAPTYFTINQNTGSISVIRDLKTDPARLQFYQVRMILKFENFFYHYPQSQKTLLSELRSYLIEGKADKEKKCNYYISSVFKIMIL